MSGPAWTTRWRGHVYVMDEHGRLHLDQLDTEGGRAVTPRPDTPAYWAAVAALAATRWDRPDETGRTWRQPNSELFKPWAPEPLDGCECGCGGNVQRWARHRADLGTLDGTPLSINTHEQQMSPRLAGPGPISLALDTAITARERARS